MSSNETRLSRRQALTAALAAGAGVIISGAAAVELVDHGVLPGKHYLDLIDGACDVAPPPETFGPLGATKTGAFYSKARRCDVGYTISYPPGHGVGDKLPLALCLHGFGGNHASGLGGISVAQALACRTPAGVMAPMAIATSDGGGLYWNAHPGDNPQAMLVDELVPMCRDLGLGTQRGTVGVIGVSMGGYGALLLAEQHPRLISAVGAISPAIFPNYEAAIAADPKSFASADAFTRDDVITGARRLEGRPVRVASGLSDPFHPGVVAFERALPKSHEIVVQITKGCHDGGFFASQQHATLAFVSSHLQRA